MIGDPANLFTINWQIIRTGASDAFVLEFTDGQLALTFGPMPFDVVEHFLLERKQAVTRVIDLVVTKLNTEKTNGQDPTQKDEPLPAPGV